MRRLQPEDRFFALAVAVALVAICVEVTRRHGGSAWSEALGAPRGVAVVPEERPDAARSPGPDAPNTSESDRDASSPTPAAARAEPLATGLVIVRVRGLESSQPLEDYEVRLVAPDDEAVSLSVPSKTTPRSGSVRFQAPERTTLLARAHSRKDPTRTAVSGAFQVAAEGVREVVLELRTSDLVPFYAFVEDPDGRPLEGVVVRMGEDTSTASDAAGGFVLEVPSGYSRSALLEREDLVPRRIRVSDEHTHPGRAARFVLQPAALLTVQVLGRIDPNLVCSWTAPETGDDEKLEVEPRKGDERSARRYEFEFGRVPASRRLVIELDRGRPSSVRIRVEEVRLAPGEEGRVVLDLDAGARVFGVLTREDGTPVAGQRVFLERAIGEHFNLSHDSISSYDLTTSDRHGRFEFRGVPPGPWWLGATPVPVPDSFQGWIAEDRIARIGTTFELAPEEAERRVDLVAYAGRSIRGRVLDPYGKPMLGHYGVAAERVETGERFGALTFGEGEFVLEPLAPGEYRLWASARRAFVESEVAVLSAGATDLELVLREPLELRVTAVDARTGEDVPADVTLRRLGGGPRLEGYEFSLGFYTDESAFVAEYLSPGSYGISAHTRDGRFGAARVSLEPWDRTPRVRLELRPGAVLAVKNRTKTNWLQLAAYADGDRVADALCVWSWDEELVLPPGRVRVVAKSAEGSYEHEVDLEVGERRTLVLDD